MLDAELVLLALVFFALFELVVSGLDSLRGGAR
jgi:hypothetical protein